MTREQRAQARAICEAATGRQWVRRNGQILCPLGSGDMLRIGGGFDANDAIFIAHARTALPAVLDYIEQLERKVKIALETCPNGGNDGYITPRPCQCEMESLEADRDQWKARAEAMERAIIGARDCSFCTHRNIDRLENVYCDACLFSDETRPRWQFDEARFAAAAHEV